MGVSKDRDIDVWGEVDAQARRLSEDNEASARGASTEHILNIIQDRELEEHLLAVTATEEGSCKNAPARSSFFFKWSGCLAVSLAVTLIVLFVGGGFAAQSAINAADVSITHFVVRDIQLETLQADLSLNFDNRAPFDLALSVSQFFMSYNENRFAVFEIPRLYVTSYAYNDVHMKNISIIIINQDVFDTFWVDLMGRDALSLAMTSSTEVTALGLKFEVDLAKEVPIVGLGGLSALSILNQRVARSTPESLVLEALIKVENPSGVTLTDLKSLKLIAESRGSQVGEMRVMNLTLPVLPGSNFFLIETILSVGGGATSDQERAVRSLVGDYMSGRAIELQLKGCADSVPLFPLAKAFSSLDISTSFNGLATVLQTRRRKTIFGKKDYEASLLSSIPSQLQASYFLSGYAGVENAIFSLVFAEFNYPALLALPDPVSCPRSQLHLYEDVVVLLNNPTAVNVSLHSLALNIFTISDGSPAAFEFPEAQLATVDAISSVPLVTVPARGYALMRQRLCLSDDTTFLQRYFTEYIPQRSGKSFDDMVSSSLSFPLSLYANGTVSTRNGDFDALLESFEAPIPGWALLRHG